MKTGSQFIISKDLLNQIGGGVDPNGPQDKSGTYGNVNGHVGGDLHGNYNYAMSLQVGVAPNISVNGSIIGNYNQPYISGAIGLKVGF